MTILSIILFTAYYVCFKQACIPWLSADFLFFLNWGGIFSLCATSKRILKSKRELIIIRYSPNVCMNSFQISCCELDWFTCKYKIYGKFCIYTNPANIQCNKKNPPKQAIFMNIYISSVFVWDKTPNQFCNVSSNTLHQWLFGIKACTDWKLYIYK